MSMAGHPLNRPILTRLGMARDEDHVFGMPTRKKEAEWDAAQLIRGGYTEVRFNPLIY